MCRYYTGIKADFLYRGDLLDAVPFVAIDDEPIMVQTADTLSLLQSPFVLETEYVERHGPVQRVPCVASLERLPGVVLLRTCEANRRPHKRRIYPSIRVAPVRPLGDFGVDQTTGKPYSDLIAEGFPSEDGTNRLSQAYRFMLIPECKDHAMQAGVVCFREAQPIPIRHLLSAKRLGRLSKFLVGVMTQRMYAYDQQTDVDDASDEAPEGEDSTIVARFKKKLERDAVRAGQRKPAS